MNIKKSNDLAIAGFICSLTVSALVGLILCIVANSKKDEYNSCNEFILPGIIISACRLVLETIIILVFIALYLEMFILLF